MSKLQARHGTRLGRAEKLYAEGQYKKALATLPTAARDPETLKAKAQSLAMLGRTREAIDCYRAIVRCHPGTLLALTDLAAFLMSQNRFKQAIQTYDKAIRLHPNAAVLHRGRALALRGQGDGEAALKSYDAALQLDDSDGNTWAAKADLLIELQRFSAAVQCLEKANATSSRSLTASSWSSRGANLAREGALDEAIHCFDRALEKDAKEYSALLGKASALQRKGDVEGAIASYDLMIAVRPQDARGWAEKGSILARKRRADEALRCYSTAVELEPSNKYLWFNRGNCRSDLEQYSQAMSDYDKAIELDADFAYAWEGKGVCLFYLERHREALSAWRRALELAPDLMWSNNNIGWVLAGTFGKYEEALQWYDRAIKLGPNESRPVVNKAKALIALKRVPEANTLIEGVLQNTQGEERSSVLTTLADVYSEQFKDARKALELLEQAASLGATGLSLTCNIAEMLIRLDRHAEGRARASSVLNGDASPRHRTVAAFLVYASHALEGDLTEADRGFTDFAARMVELASASDPKEAGVKWGYDGFLDKVVKSSASLATKFALVAAVDLQSGQLGAPGLSNLRQSLPLIHAPAPPPPVEAPDRA
jgi:tetratricopeptide (TPR) repeat protein